MARKYKTLSAYFDNPDHSQQALASLLGVTRSAVCYWVAGKRQPSLSMALEIERITGVPASALVTSEKRTAA